MQIALAQVPTDVVAAKRMSLGGIGGGIVLRTKSRDTAYTTDSMSKRKYTL